MAIQESGEMYLETILILSLTRTKVRSIDVCEYMNYSKPSVSRAMSLLKTQEMITIDNNGYISLTDSGKAIAEKIYERHTLLTELLIKLGVNPVIASADACRIEHVISDQSFTALKSLLDPEEIQNK